jgi:hypothetical protein
MDMAVEEVVEQTDEEVLNDDETPEVKEVVVDEDEDKIDEDEDKTEDKTDEDKPFPFERPLIKEIKAEYPDIFKKFPTIRDSLFQEIEYRKIFPNLDDAKEAVEDNIAFNGLRDSVLSGDPKPLLNAIDETDNKGLVKFAHSFLPALREKSAKTYSEVITPLFENFVRQLGNSRDENDRNAALVAARFLFGSDGDAIVEGKKTLSRVVEETEEEKAVKAERNKIADEQYKGFHNTVVNEMHSGLDKIITRGLDPDGTMTDAAKRMLVKEIKEEVGRVLQADANHLKIMDSHWLRSKRKGFNAASKDMIVSAYLSRAKQVVGPIRDKARNEFLGVRKKTSEETTKKIVSAPKSVVNGKAASGERKPQVTAPRKIDWRKTSDLDVLNDNITER